MKKGASLVISIILVSTLLFSIVSVSAFSFSGFWDKITGHVVDLGGNCKNIYYNINNEYWNGTNNVLGVKRSGNPTVTSWPTLFLCSEGNFYACGWTVTNNSAAINVNPGDKRGSWQCSSSGWVSSSDRDCFNIFYNINNEYWNGTDNSLGASHFVSGKNQVDWRQILLCYNRSFYACGWSINNSAAITTLLGNRIGDWYCNSNGWDNTPLSRYEGNPILVGDQQWEKGSSRYYNVFEPTVVIDSNAPSYQRYKMIYSAGWGNSALGLAYSSDLIHWTKYENNPVIGQANLYPGRGSGINGNADESTLIFDSDYWYIYFNNGYPGDIIRAKSTDLINWALDGNDVRGRVIGNSSKSWSFGWYNTGVWKDSNNLWNIYVDGSKKAGYGPQWFESYATSSDGKTWLFSPDSTSAYFEPMPSLGITPSPGIYGSLTPPKVYNGKYYVFYHGGTGAVPNEIYLASSTNPNGPWQIYKNNPVLKLSNEKNISDVSPIDQLADAWWLEENGKLYLFYDVDNNADGANGKVHISLAIYNGTFSDFIDKINSPYVPSPTPNPQPTPQICTSFTYSYESCSVTCGGGTQSMTILTSSPSGCGGGNYQTSQACNLQACVPLCTESDWSHSDSSCQSSNNLTRTWSLNGACNGGVSHSTSEVVSCVYQAPACVYTYSSFGECTSSNTKSRNVLTSSPANCQGVPDLSMTCNYISLCTESDWSHSDSSCQSSNTSIRTWKLNGICNSGISHPASESIACVYQAPSCVYTYLDWGDCSVSGIQSRFVNSSLPANCQGSANTTRNCDYVPLCIGSNWDLNDGSCQENNTLLRNWSKVGNCDSVLGVNKNNSETISCNFSALTCTSFNYSDWGDCLSSGIKTRQLISSYPDNCQGGNITLSVICNYVALRGGSGGGSSRTVSNTVVNSSSKPTGPSQGNSQQIGVSIKENGSIKTFFVKIICRISNLFNEEGYSTCTSEYLD